MQLGNKFRRVALSALACSVVIGGSAGALSSGETAAVAWDEASGAQVSAPVLNRYIVGLRQPALGMADAAGIGLPRTSGNRLDVRSPEALTYVSQLRNAQDQFMNSLAARLQRPVQPFHPDFQFQHAFNGMVLELTLEEVELLRADPQVSLIEPDIEHALDTDASQALIGSPTIWDGTNVPGSLATRGEGVVVGVIDSGVNIASEAFAATDAGGYTHTNPLGAGNYLGWCNPANPNHVPARDICNSKLIGGWDFADAANAGSTTNIEAPGFEDDAGHGSHTASTAAGNARTVTFNGLTRNVSGVAPHANLVSYDVCHTTSTGTGSCFNSATLAAINQVLVDGIVDVVNYSISGGALPWNEANSQAFLTIANAGVFVAASAGNSGPGAATVAHLEPWVTTVANSTHNRVFGFDFDLTGPLMPPANTQNITVRPGGAPIATTTLSAPIIVSPNFANGATDGCSPFPANFFRRPADAGGVQGIAVLRLTAGTSQCASGARRTAALNAGAAGVLYVDVTPLSLGANNTSYSMLQADWDLVAAHIASDPSTATATISVPLTAGPGTPDVMANSSSRGPGVFDMLKPDLSAPGTEILAAYTRWVAALPRPFGGAVNPALNNVANAISGTSMASPHVAGSAALMRALRPAWTPTQIKSALVMTTKLPMFKQDGVTPADPFDNGSGRLDLTVAAKAGLIMDETGDNFTAANPATGGDTTALNLPSFQNGACVTTCVFPRSVLGTRAAAVTWTATVTGLPAGAGSVVPSVFTASSAATTDFALEVDSSLIPNNQWSFGTVVLTPSNPSIPVSRMSIAVRAALPDISLSETAFSASAAPDSMTTQQLQVSNLGNPTLTWSAATGSQAANLLNQPVALGNGFLAGAHTVTTASRYMADDVILPADGSITTVRADGFVLPGTSLLSQMATATSVNVAIYADDNGVPAGAPAVDGTLTGATGAAPVFFFSAAPTATGINVTGNNIIVDLVAAGATPPALLAGRYWVLVYPSMVGSGAGSGANALWAWRITGVGAPLNGLAPLSFNPNTPATPWAVPSLTGAPGPGPAEAFTMTINGTVDCGAPWLSATPSGGSLGNNETDDVTVSFDATGLAEGVYTAALCISTSGSDPDEPLTVIPVTFVVQADALFDDGFED